MRNILGIVGLILAISITVAPVATASELGYKPGDWIRYKMNVTINTITRDEIKCVFLIIVNISDISGTFVEYYYHVEYVSGDRTQCLDFMKISYEGPNIVDVSRTDPEEGGVFVNPKYTGTYDYYSGSLVGKSTYDKGVLVKAELTAKDPELEGKIIIELDDTSIGWLKPWYKTWHENPLIIGLIIGAVVVVVVIILVIVLRRKTRAVEQPLQPQPSTPSAPQPPSPYPQAYKPTP
mgnify:CR=1 FL=1